MVLRNKGGTRMSRAQSDAGRRAWARSGAGAARELTSNVDFERTAPKAWIRYVDGSGEPIETIECELYKQPHSDGSGQLVGMLHGMCPKCHATFIVREENKEMSLGDILFARVPGWLEEQYRHHLALTHGLKSGRPHNPRGPAPRDEELVRPPRGDDRLPLVSGTNRVEEPWMCASCQDWCVVVYENVARDTGVSGRRIYSDLGAAPERPRPKGVDV